MNSHTFAIFPLRPAGLAQLGLISQLNQSGSANSVSNMFNFLEFLHSKSPLLSSHLKAFIMKQHYRNRVLTNSN